MSITTGLIKQLRALGLTQVEISRRTGIPQPRISKWQAGNTPAIADDVLKLRDLVNELTARPAEKPTDAPVAATERRSTPKPEGGKPVPAPMPHEWHERGRDRRRIWNPSELLTTGEDTERRQKERRRGHAS